MQSNALTVYCIPCCLYQLSLCISLGVRCCCRLGCYGSVGYQRFIVSIVVFWSVWCGFFFYPGCCKIGFYFYLSFIFYLSHTILYVQKIRWQTWSWIDWLKKLVQLAFLYDVWRFPLSWLSFLVFLIFWPSNWMLGFLYYVPIPNHP